MTEAATVSTTADPDLVVVSGELDGDSCRPVQAVLLEALTTRIETQAEDDVFEPAAFLVDLSGVTFVASAALSVLVDLDARASAGFVPLVLVVPDETPLAKLLTQTGLRDTLTLAGSVDLARRR